MKIIKITGGIWPWTAQEFEWNLNRANGEDIEINIHSPGGSVTAGLKIYNLISNYSGKVTTRNTGLVASIATIVMLAGDEVVSDEAAIFMIHNAQTFIEGDHNELRKSADVIDAISLMMANIYSKKTGKSVSEIRKKMDATTYFVGNKMKEFGFVDRMIESKNPVNKTEIKTNAVIEIDKFFAELKESDTPFENIDNIAASMESIGANFRKTGTAPDVPVIAKKAPATDSRGTNKEITMDLKTFKAEHPGIYNEVVQVGKDIGIAEERDSVCAHLVMGESSGDMETAIGAIKDGKKMTATIQATYMAAGMNKSDIEARGEENNNAGDQANSEENEESDDSAKVLAQVAENLGIVEVKNG